MKRIFLFMIIATSLFGCAEESATPEKKEPGVIRYLTGAEQLNTYRRTKSRIIEIDKSLKERNTGY